MPISKEEVLTALKECYDPEIPVNIVDLGYDARMVKNLKRFEKDWFPVS
jgi:metal-sulfur cluster biosynthetic enzyme